MDDDAVRTLGRSMDEVFYVHGRTWNDTGRSAAGRPLGIADFDLDEAIQDSRLRENLASHHIDAGTVAAMTLVPLIAVAWADRDLHESERAAVMRAAEAAGIGPGSASHALLESWLQERPDPELFERWKSFIVALCADMDVGEVEALRAELVGRARAIAEAGGGFLGFRRVSPREREVLDELEHAFPA